MYDLLGVLPSWMLFILAILLITSPLIFDLIRQTKKKKDEQLLSIFLKEMVETGTENQKFVRSFKNYIEELYSKLDVLLDLLYERYANNLSVDMSSKVIELVYERTYFKVLNFLTDYISNDKKYDENGLKVGCIRSDLSTTIRTRYYTDMMILNKMTCKNINLDLHLVTVDSEVVINDILEFLQENKDKRSWELHNSTKKFLESYFITLINKAQFKLEEVIKERVS